MSGFGGGLIDKGGAEVARARQRRAAEGWEPRPITLPGDVIDEPVDETPRRSKPYIVVRVMETHDGVACGCLDKGEMVLCEGDTLTLDHVCNDGRVDKIIATVVSVKFPPEHGTATVA